MEPVAIQHDRTGLRVASCNEKESIVGFSIQWSEVDSVVAFKRDIFVYDLICIILRTSDGALELNEEMKGWESMIDSLPAYLPGARKSSDWWDQVAHPAFVANLTTIYSKTSEATKVEC
jgi:hypothetical protein